MDRIATVPSLVPLVPANSEVSQSVKRVAIPENDTPGCLKIAKPVPLQGDEHSTKSPGKTLGKSNGGNAGGNIPSELAELIELWPILTKTVRKQCLELARCSMAKNP